MASGGEPLSSVYQELNPSGPKEIDPKFFWQSLPRDAIRPIYYPKLARPEEVTLESDDTVIGVSIGGESRAYPISTLRFREMVNDTLGDIPILVTW